MKNKGFTLIELLVVIAIIGLLSSVVLVSLNSARRKGNDAKLQSTVSGVRAAAEVYYSNYNKYYTDATNNMFFDPKVMVYTSSILSVGGAIATTASSTGYAVAGRLVSDTAKGFCVDALGNATTSAWANIDTAAELADAAGCL